MALRRGLIVAGLNHAMHSRGDNGYDEEGNKINDLGGDKTDYKFKNDGTVESVNVIHTMRATRPYNIREYGIDSPGMASGACTQDNTIADFFTGGAVTKGVGSILSSKSASLVLKYPNYFNKGNWWRLGLGKHNGQELMRAAWGAHPNYLNKVPKALQGLNKLVRSIGGGHWDLPNWKP